MIVIDWIAPIERLYLIVSAQIQLRISSQLRQEECFRSIFLADGKKVR